MKIASIDSKKSRKGEYVAFRTEPPLSKDVFDKFLEMGENEKFSREGELLLWYDSTGITEGFVQRANRYLTEAKNSIEADKTTANKERDTFLAELSNSTRIDLEPKSVR